MRELQGYGEIAIRELARRVGRDVKRVHEAVGVLTELGLVERGSRRGVVCPLLIDMRLQPATASAA